MIDIEFKRSFLKNLKEIEKEDQAYILKKLELFKNEEENLDIKKMEPKKSGYYRLRAGKYRLIYKHLNANRVVFLKVDKRDRIYTNF